MRQAIARWDKRLPPEKQGTDRDSERPAESITATWLRYSGNIMKEKLGSAPLDPIGLTRQLCEIESTTYHEGRGRRFSRGVSWRARMGSGEDSGAAAAESGSTEPRWNVYGGPKGETPDLVFSTHMDTVPPYIPFSEDAEFMYGRGVSDAKGIIAAQVAAAEALRAAGFRIGVLFVSGEERDSAGAKAANLAPKGSRFLINGEPTDNRAGAGVEGRVARGASSATGKMAHSAYPELGDSAVHKLVQVLAKLLQIGPAGDGRRGPEHAEHRTDSRRPRAECDCRQGRGAGAGAAGGRLGAGAQPRCWKRRRGWRKWTSRWRFRLCGCAPWKGLPTMVAKFTTDIPQLSNWGEPLLLGPGSIHVAHTPFEKLAKKELLEAVELYIKVAKQLLALTPSAIHQLQTIH